MIERMLRLRTLKPRAAARFRPSCCVAPLLWSPVAIALLGGCFARSVVLDSDAAADSPDAAVPRDAADAAPADADADRRDADPDAPLAPYARCTIFGEPPPATAPVVQRTCLGAPAIPGCGVIEVPGGAMVLGDERIVFDGGITSVQATPLQPDVTISSFQVDAMEVSVARFRRFVDATIEGWQRPAQVYMPDCARSLLIRDLRLVLPRFTNTAEAATYTATPGPNEAHPVNWVNWDAAMLFCAYEGGRLPTESEWEYLARYRPVEGISPGRRFASGDELPTGCRRSWSFGCPAIGTARLYTTPVDDTDNVIGGVHHLMGNVIEMTLDYRQNYRARSAASPRPRICWEQLPQHDPLCQFVEPISAGNRELIFRGASLRDRGPLMYAASRNHIDGYNVTHYEIGFRCVYPPG